MVLLPGEFVRSKLLEKTIVHLDISSTLWHKDSEEAKMQMQKEDGTFEEGIKTTKFINSVSTFLKRFLLC